METIKNLFYIGVFIIGLAVVAEVLYLTHCRIHGTPRGMKHYEEMKQTKDETINAQKITIKELQDVVRQQRIKIRKLYDQLDEREIDK